MVDTTSKTNSGYSENESENGALNPQFLLKTLILRWQWILLSLFICVAAAFVYLRYTSPVFQIAAKILIKENDQRMSRRAASNIQAADYLGFMTNSDGFDNEIEVLKSVSIAEGAVRDLKLYINYKSEGRVKDQLLYKNNPIVIDMDKQHLDTLKGGLKIEVTRQGNLYNVSGEYKNPVTKEEFNIEKSGVLPMTLNTKVGVVSIALNPLCKEAIEDGRSIIATINNPTDVASAYSGGMTVEPLSKTTTIANIVHNDLIPERGIDFLKQLAIVYNRMANIDKNEIAVRTEEFINQRLEKINVELGNTDSAIETYKRNNSIVDPVLTAGQALTNTDATEKELIAMGTQLLLLESVKEYINNPANKYRTLPSNVGLSDPASTALIAQYNTIALERNRILSTASEISPSVIACTNQLDELSVSIRGAIAQAEKNLKIEQQALRNTFNKYSNKVSNSPEQEKFLTEIGRQQEVKSSLYIMLLQKREENSISLAATADKGKLIDEPMYMGKVSPKSSMILLIALVLGLALPFGIFILMEMLRFRIEGHEDLEKLTSNPIIADVAIANEKAKSKGEIVVQENKNDQMAEVFRGMRTNLQFVMKEEQNVVMFTSTTSGEGKTFIASNLAVSFALLGKKVLLVGLDIRRPRLAALFGIKNASNKGITMLLGKEEPTINEIRSQITPSGVNDNLDLLMAGPVPPNPAEIVSRKSLESVFEILRKEYDYILVDTAPVGLVSDTLQIGRVVDINVLVCRADYTEKSALTEVNKIIVDGKLPTTCIVLNGIDMTKRKYGYAYGYGKYGYYSKYGSYLGKGKSYGYHSYGYGSYTNSHYGNANDESIKK